MKKMIKCLFTFALPLGVSPGEVKAEVQQPAPVSEEEVREEEDFGLLCENYCDWCAGVNGPYCSLNYCIPEDPCSAHSQQLIQCLQVDYTCTPASGVCQKMLENWMTCKELVPTCGDGMVSGDEECEAPEGSEECVNCKLVY